MDAGDVTKSNWHKNGWTHVMLPKANETRMDGPM